MVLFQNEGKIFQVPADQWQPIYEQFTSNGPGTPAKAMVPLTNN